MDNVRLFGRDKLPSVLPRDQEMTLLTAAKAGDRQAYDKLVKHNLRLVLYVAQRYEGQGIEFEDLVSIGTFGLLRSINIFDCSRDLRLSTLAGVCIRYEIAFALRYLRAKCRAAEMRKVSLDSVVSVAPSGDAIRLADVLGDEDNSAQRIETDQVNLALYAAVDSALDSAERRVIKERYFYCDVAQPSQTVVGERLNMSQVAVSRAERRALKKLRLALAYAI